MLATAPRTTKPRATPGQLAGDGETDQSTETQSINAPRSRKAETVVVKDLAKKPQDAEQAKNPEVECETVEEALQLANQRNRAVFCREGWVCPSIIRERG